MLAITHLREKQIKEEQMKKLQERVTKLESEEKHYLYGKFYNADQERIPSEDGEYDVIIYNKIRPDESRTIGSLEGIFISSKPITQNLLRRNQMQDYEKRYKGKFIPFENGEKK